ncbi:MAG: phosphohydrolase [Cytophagales bacterium]|nr:MAG: phosphohydrolase [Cytophagales bacterium]
MVDSTYKATAQELDKAILMAAKAHFGFTDKAGQPYTMHVLRVMMRGQTLMEQICGVLHDLIEDTPYTEHDLRAEGFSEDIIEVVKLLTHDKSLLSYEEYIQRLVKHPVARKVKINDLLDNMDIRRLPTVKERDLERSNKYLHYYRYLIQYDETASKPL